MFKPLLWLVFLFLIGCSSTNLPDANTQVYGSVTSGIEVTR